MNTHLPQTNSRIESSSESATLFDQSSTHKFTCFSASQLVLLIVFLSSLLFASCQKSKAESKRDEPYMLTLDDIESAEKSDTINRKIESVEFINLDDSIPITEMSKFISTANHYLILDRKSKKILVFDKKGDLKTCIADIGKSKFEYHKILDLQATDSMIYAFTWKDIQDRHISKYDLNILIKHIRC